MQDRAATVLRLALPGLAGTASAGPGANPGGMTMRVRKPGTPRRRGWWGVRQRAAVLLLLVAAGVSAASPPIVRGVYCHPGEAIENRPWAAYGSGYELDPRNPRSGTVSMRCSNATATGAQGGWQAVQFRQERPRPLVVAGWARLEGVAGSPSYHCSVYLDLVLADGQSWPMKTALFDPGKEGWQYAEQVYTPPAPIVSARVYAFLREAQGTAWFDDLYVGEVLDDRGTRSANLLRSPGFEPEPEQGQSAREALFASLRNVGCNAFHFYSSAPWPQIMGSAELPPIPAGDRRLDFVREAQRQGFGVWLTVGEPWPPIADHTSPEFPCYACVNGRWGEAYTRAVAFLAQLGVDGIGVVPDEWTLDNGRVKSVYARHKDPVVAGFYAALAHFCDCPACRGQFQERYGEPLPDVKAPWSSADPVWARFAQFRYDSTTAWVARTVAAARRANPAIVTDTMICVLPVCSDNRLAAGAAWDEIGVRTGLDCLQTDPYIQLHNYLGDSTHYYATETTLHLAAANWRGRAGVTLEACRLRETDREKDPAEVYGTALSCLIHGAREFFWWHLDYLLGRHPYVAPEAPSRRVAAFHRVVQAMEPALAGAAPPGGILVLYSRLSEDTWDRLGKTNGAPKRGFIAHRNVLYFLLRRGYPFRMTFLDNPDPARLEEARVVLVPFPAALPEAQVALLERLARDGRTVILFSELAGLDELGRPRPPALARLFGGQPPPALDRTEPAEAALGAGRVVFLGGDAAVGLFQAAAPVRDRTARVPVPAFDGEPCRRLDALLTAGLGRPGSILTGPPETDLEATLAEGPGGRLLLAVNWDTARDAEVRLRSETTAGAARADGYRIDAEGAVHEERRVLPAPGTGWTFRLAPQDAVLLRLE